MLAFALIADISVMEIVTLMVDGAPVKYRWLNIASNFLGFGLSPEQPAVGIILSESMKYLSTGMWWLAFFPGLMLVIIVLLFDRLGENLKKIIDPYSSHE